MNKRVFKNVLFVFIISLLLFSVFTINVKAQTLDDLAAGEVQVIDGSQIETQSNNYSDPSSEAITDYLKGYNPITSEQMNAAQTYSSPIVNLLGILSGILVTITSAAIFTVTALDLLYIGVPVVRPYLDGGQSAVGGSPMDGGMGMGGMGMGGMGMRGMGMRGMGGMGGGMSQSQSALSGHCFVSDEALNCVKLAQTAQAGPAMSPMGGMGGMGMGMGMGMGGAMPQPQTSVPTKSIIFTYLKKRMFFLIIFTVATIVLMSSIFTDCGINLAQLFMNIMNRVNNSISNIQV